MAKKKKGKISKQKENVLYSIDTSDPRRDTKFGLWALKNVQKADSWSAPFFFIAKWDKRLGFKLIRLILLTIPALILLPDKLLEWISGIQEPFLKVLPGLNKIMGVYEDFFTWISSETILYMPLASIIFPLSLVVAMASVMKNRMKSYEKINFKLLFFTFLDLVTMYGSIKYQTPIAQPIMTTLLFILIILTIGELLSLKRYHKEHGPYNPSKLLKQGDRRAKKRGRKEINRKKA